VAAALEGLDDVRYLDHDRERDQRRRHHVRCHVITAVSSVLCTPADVGKSVGCTHQLESQRGGEHFVSVCCARQRVVTFIV